MKANKLMKNGIIVTSRQSYSFDDFTSEQIKKFQKVASYFAEAIPNCQVEPKKDETTCDPDNCENFQKEGYNCYQCCRSDVWGDKCAAFKRVKLALYIDGKEYDYTQTKSELQNCMSRELIRLYNKFIEDNKSPEQKFIESYLRDTKDLNYQDAMIAAINWGKEHKYD